MRKKIRIIVLLFALSGMAGAFPVKLIAQPFILLPQIFNRFF